METTADRIHIAEPKPVRVSNRSRKIDWAHNPPETTRAQLAWFFLIPITMAALILAVNITSWMALH